MGVKTEKIKRGGMLYGDIDAFQDAAKIIAYNRRLSASVLPRAGICVRGFLNYTNDSTGKRSLSAE